MKNVHLFCYEHMGLEAVLHHFPNMHSHGKVVFINDGMNISSPPHSHPHCPQIIILGVLVAREF